MADKNLQYLSVAAWEDSVERDQDGAVLFDLEIQHFGVILNYVRAKKIATLEKTATFLKIPEDQVKNFNILVEYRGLSCEIVLTEKQQNVQKRLDESYHRRYDGEMVHLNVCEQKLTIRRYSLA